MKVRCFLLSQLAHIIIIMWCIKTLLYKRCAEISLFGAQKSTPSTHFSKTDVEGDISLLFFDFWIVRPKSFPLIQCFSLLYGLNFLSKL